MKKRKKRRERSGSRKSKMRRRRERRKRRRRGREGLSTRTTASRAPSGAPCAAAGRRLTQAAMLSRRRMAWAAHGSRVVSLRSSPKYLTSA